MNQGIITKENLSQAEYRAKTEYLSSSDIKTLLENPYSYKIKEKKEPSDTLILGSLIHTMLLEPNKISDEYMKLPELNLRTKADKEVLTEFEERAKAENKTLVKNDIWGKAVNVVNAFKNSDLSNIFSGGVAELSFFGEINGTKCKCRPDYFIKEKNIIYDLKTTNVKNGASYENFIKNVANFKYYIQAQFYKKLIGASEFLFIVLETTPTTDENGNEHYRNAVYKISDFDLEWANDEILRAIEIYKNLDKFNLTYCDTKTYERVQEIVLPTYLRYQKNASF